MERVVTWKTDDGKIFDDPQKARDHEDKLEKNRADEQYKDFLDTYSGESLLKDHSLDEIGIWEVRGEDPNCDMGGVHHNPYIGTVQGCLDDVIKWAVVQPNFWEHGFGGEIEKIYIQKV